MSRYSAVLSAFVYAACSIAASSSIVGELSGEIAALKAEVSELKIALNAVNYKLELCEEMVTEDRQSASTTNSTG